MDPERLARLTTICDNLATQDNRVTDQPVFAVMQKRRVYGMDKFHSEGMEVIVDEYGDKNVHHYIEMDEFVTACLTEKGCQDYIEINGHNLRSPFIFVFSAWRNAEFIAIREGLPELLQHVEKLEAD